VDTGAVPLRRERALERLIRSERDFRARFDLRELMDRAIGARNLRDLVPMRTIDDQLLGRCLAAGDAQPVKQRDHRFTRPRELDAGARRRMPPCLRSRARRDHDHAYDER